MNKKDLLMIELPKKYIDCSDWFEDGVDILPDLKDFILLGKTKKDYDKFIKLYSIENLKKCVNGTVTDEDRKSVINLIDEYIKEYNAM